MSLNVTHTYVELEVSEQAYDEIAAKLRAADYDHCFHNGAIDMHGLALVKGEGSEQTTMGTSKR